MTARFPKPGDLFEDRYRIDSVIGAGGFAKVYGATQTDLGRSVAIKVLSRGLDDEDDEERAERASRRFRREAQLVSQLRDPNTITIYDYGETADGLLYIVLERIDGRSLKEVIYDDGPMPVDQVAYVLECVLSSLEEAHELGILHRDIKPANIMLYDHVGRPGVKLLDFGIAKSAEKKIDTTSQSSELTREGALVGTPRYMAPELIRDQEMLPASDLFSLGLVAYEMLVGEQANAAQTPVTVIGRQLDPAPFVLPWRDDIPLGLRNVVHRLLQKDVANRFQTAAEAAAELAGWDESEAEDATLDITMVEVGSKPPADPVDDLDEELSAQGRPLAFVFIAIAALCVVAIVVLATQDSPPKPSTPHKQAEPIVVAVEADPAEEPPEKTEDKQNDGAPEEAPGAQEPAAPKEPVTKKVAGSKKPKKPKEPKAEVVEKVEKAPEEAEPEIVKTREEPKPETEKPSFFSLDDAL